MRLAAERTKTENLFETLANKSPVGLYIAQDGKFCYTTPAFQSITGYREDELLGMDSLELVVPEDREIVRENAIKMLRGKLALPYQFRVTHKNGHVTWVMGSVVPVRYCGRQAALGDFIDITERKQIEEALQAEKNKLQSLIDALEYTLTIQDTEYNIIYQNESSKRASGGDHVGEKCYRAYEGREMVCDGCPVEEAFKDGKPHTAERRTVILGKVAFWENTANPIRDAGGRVVACLELARDITERKKQEQALADELTRRRLLVDQSLDGIVVLDVDARVVEANQRFAEMLGYTPEEVRELHTWDWDKQFPPEKLLEMGRGIDEKGLHLETKHHRKDGSVIDVDISISAAMFGDQKLIFCVCRDVTARKRAEKALQQSEEKYRALFESTVIGTIVIDAETMKVVMANQAATKMFGFSSVEEGIGINPLDFASPNDREGLPELIGKELFEQDLRRTREVQMITKDGRKIWVSATAARIMHEGRLAGLVSFADITGRKKQEQELEENEERYKELADSITDVFFAMDEHLRYTYWNKASEILTGIRAEDALGKPLLEIFPDTPGLRRAEKAYRDVLKTQQAQTFVNDFDIDGRHYIFEINAYPSRGGISVFAKDITERKKMEEAIKQAAGEWKRTFDSISDAISIHDRDFRILRANKAFADLFGKSASEIIGKHCYELYELHKGEKHHSGCPQEQTLATKKPAAAEFYDSRLGKYLRVSTSPIFNDKGKVAGTVHITRDITEQKQQNERLTMADRLASIGELAAGAAHELNNPLTGVIGFTQLLMEKDTPDYIRKDLAFIRSEAQRAANIMSNLLTFARKHTPAKQLNQINDIIEDVLKLRAYAHKSNRIRVERHLAPDLPDIMVDYFQMQQVFFNIIINAEYFMTEAHKRGTLTITTEKQNGSVRISFADDGPGIPPANLNRIFDPFFTTKEAGKGTGLGLSICHGIVAEHGGQIYAESQLGQGATIVIELPIKSP